ncbi:hypothetical protein ACFE04_004742 [Oxalis oulophora]
MEVYKRATLSLCFAALLLSCNCMMTTITMVSSITVSNHFKLFHGLPNPQIPKLPKNVDHPCRPLSWPRIFCFDDRAAQILVHNLGLGGSLIENVNHLSRVTNVGLQTNNLTGNFPSFSGLSELELACSGHDSFSAIPLYFFQGYRKVTVFALDYDPFNSSIECSFPNSLNNSLQLINASCVGCNLIGPLPEFIGSLKSLTAPLNLSYSRLSCEISANSTTLQELQLNGDQIVCLVLEILANMELRIGAHGSTIAGSPQSTPTVSTMLGILVLAVAAGIFPSGCFNFNKKKASRNETDAEADNSNRSPGRMVRRSPENSEPRNATLVANPESSNVTLVANPESSNAPRVANPESSNAPLVVNPESSNASLVANSERGKAPVIVNSKSKDDDPRLPWSMLDVMKEIAVKENYDDLNKLIAIHEAKFSKPEEVNMPLPGIQFRPSVNSVDNTVLKEDEESSRQSTVNREEVNPSEGSTSANELNMEENKDSWFWKGWGP